MGERSSVFPLCMHPRRRQSVLDCILVAGQALWEAETQLAAGRLSMWLDVAVWVRGCVPGRVSIWVLGPFGGNV